MNKLGLVLAAACAVFTAHAQNVLSSVSIMGSLTASTLSGHDVYTMGGGPRTGHYWYWRPVTLQTTDDSVPFAFNASTGTVSTKGTYYSPNYTASGVAATSLSNGPTAARITFALKDTVSPIPLLPIHEYAHRSVQADPRFYFTVPNDTDITITMSGTATPAYNLYALSGEISPSESGVANSYTLMGGGTYCFWGDVATNASTTGTTGQSFNLRLDFAVAGG